MFNSHSTIPIFSGENYEFWGIKMRTFFISQDLWKLVDNAYAENASDMRELQKKAATALIVLQRGVSDETLPPIANVDKSKEAMQEFYGDSKVTTVNFKLCKENLKFYR